MLFMPCHVGQKFTTVSSQYDIERKFIFVAAFVFSVIVASEFAEIRAFQYHTPEKWRGLGPFINSNHGGGFAALMAMWCLHCGQKNRSVIYAFWQLFWRLGFAHWSDSLSRGAILALAFGFGVAMVIPVLSRRQLSRPSLVIITLVSAICVFVIYFERATLIPMLRELSSLKSETGVSKTTPWLGVPELLMRYPFGVGVGGLYAVLPQLNLPLTTSGRIFLFGESGPAALR